MKNAEMLPCPIEPMANAFKALANPLRLFLLNELLDHPRNVSHLAAVVHEGQSSVSKHLQILAASGFIRRTRHGNEILCSANTSLVCRLWKMCGLSPALGSTEDPQSAFCPEI